MRELIVDADQAPDIYPWVVSFVRIFEDENAWHAQVRQISVANKISEEFVWFPAFTGTN